MNPIRTIAVSILATAGLLVIRPAALALGSSAFMAVVTQLVTQPPAAP